MAELAPGAPGRAPGNPTCDCELSRAANPLWFAPQVPHRKKPGPGFLAMALALAINIVMAIVLPLRMRAVLGSGAPLQLAAPSQE